jgi:hypothetical protein
MNKKILINFKFFKKKTNKILKKNAKKNCENTKKCFKNKKEWNKNFF